MFYSKGIQAPKEHILYFQKLLENRNPLDFRKEMRDDEYGMQMNSEHIRRGKA